MGCCYGGVNTFLDPVSDLVSRAERALTPSHSLGVGALSFGKEFGPVAGLQAKNPRRSEEFFVGAQERTRTSTVLPAST